MKNKPWTLSEIAFVVSPVLAVVGITIGMGFELFNIILIGLLVTILTVQIAWFSRWSNSAENFFKKDYTKNRDRALELIRNTKLHLYSTHFAKTAPPSIYSERIIEKLNEGIDVYRIVSKENLNQGGISEWLGKFEQFPNYNETITDKDLPFDVSVFDGKKTILYFPSHPHADDFDLTLYIESEELSTIFLMLFSKIKGAAIEHSPMNMPKGSGVWLKDAYHVPYLVVEGVINGGDTSDIHSLMSARYREIDLNNIGKCFAMDNNNKAIFCVDHNRCSLCYFISGETTNGSSYMDLLLSIRGSLDTMVADVEMYLAENATKVEFSRVYLQDPARHFG